MKKTITEIIEVEENEHEFYCDECGKYIGTSYEYDDGWYDELGEFELACNINGWLRLKKCLCDKCAHEFINKVRTVLFDIGFEVEK